MCSCSAALAFALLHVLQRDGLIDRAFVAAHTVGWDELEPLLKDCTPAWGEATTGVSARLIEEAAHLYGEGPSLLWLGQALQLDSGAAHTCAIDTAGTLSCWGHDLSGQALVPDGIGAVAQVTAGLRHTCAVDQQGTPSCWGWNDGN